ncbi:2-C-methyl-D-erythritol 4-phosphate cytidylyltransferase [Bacillus timonensis]|nr:2-C-methyl-D-erythritol 4-phosphate cytidylyltransferase [Bacillus timonensis]
MNYQVVIPAAGQGKRMNAGKNKQFISIKGVPVIVRTLKVFESDDWCDGMILSINKSEEDEFKALFQTYNITKVKAFVDGGAERQHSVYNGIKAIKNSEIVLVHDGARPFITIDKIHELVEVAKSKGASILAVPVKDTIKQAFSDQTVEKTVERSNLWSVQTPQAFHYDVIRNAHEIADRDEFLGTDDASLVERLGRNIQIIIGDYQNIKLTTPDDLIFAEAILNQWKK